MRNKKDLFNHRNFMNNQNYVKGRLQKINPILWTELLQIVIDWYCFYDYDENNKYRLEFLYAIFIFFIVIHILSLIAYLIMGWNQQISYIKIILSIFWGILWCLMFFGFIIYVISFILFKMFWYKPFKFKVYVYIYRGRKILICKL